VKCDAAVTAAAAVCVCVCVCVCVYSDIELLFLVGGFAESATLQADIKQQFGQRVKVAIPQDASLAILKGRLLPAIQQSLYVVRDDKNVVARRF